MTSASNGPGFVYVAVCSGPEDLLKVGLSHDPVARWSAFHRRWFEAFDLDQSLLIQTGTRREAQALETALHRLLRDHNCPAPLTMRCRFGGGTEWYRGACRSASEFARAAERQGHVLHAPARAWFARAMQGRADALAGLLDQAMRDMASGAMTPAQYDALNDLVDAHRAFDEDVATRFSAELAMLSRLKAEAWPRG
ncbi:MAG TPA: GIY-YIG nuclease family protein [Lysobacter sp.]|nr:GIY-YIG nuclease family protein [Lysobacter sp.]